MLLTNKTKLQTNRHRRQGSLKLIQTTALLSSNSSPICSTASSWSPSVFRFGLFIKSSNSGSDQYEIWQQTAGQPVQETTPKLQADQCRLGEEATRTEEEDVAAVAAVEGVVEETEQGMALLDEEERYKVTTQQRESRMLQSLVNQPHLGPRSPTSNNKPSRRPKGRMGRRLTCASSVPTRLRTAPLRLVTT